MTVIVYVCEVTVHFDTSLAQFKLINYIIRKNIMLNK